MQSDSISLAPEPPVEYRDIAGFPGYRVGDDGSVWSCWQESRDALGRAVWSLGLPWRRMKTPLNSSGYPKVGLRRDGKYRQVAVHILVLEAFVGPCPPGMECRHFPDRNPQNCRRGNLAWGTRFENQADRNFHGTDNRGSRHPMAKHSEATVIAVRARFAAGGIRKFELAREYGLTNSEVGKIIKRVTWKHV